MCLVKICAFFLLALFSLEASHSSKIFIGPQAYYYHLHIANGTNTGPTATPNPFTGTLGGFILGYEYKNNLYGSLQSSYAQGNLTRKNQGTGNNQRSVNEFILDGRLGYDWKMSSFWSLTPFTGAGWRWNIQDRDSGVLSALTYEYYKIYIPVGAVLTYSPTDKVSLGIDFEWMPDILTMTSLSSLKGAYWELKRKNNYLVQIPLQFRINARFELSLIPFWMQFDDGASISETNIGIALNLENQITNDWGARLSLGIRF